MTGTYFTLNTRFKQKITLDSLRIAYFRLLSRPGLSAIAFTYTNLPGNGTHRGAFYISFYMFSVVVRARSWEDGVVIVRAKLLCRVAYWRKLFTSPADTLAAFYW